MILCHQPSNRTKSTIGASCVARRSRNRGSSCVVVAFLLDPKGKRERSERKAGIPNLAGEAGVDEE
jgi:hypothetical protein